MDTKTFIKVMRKLIREEVRSAVRAEMKQVLKEEKVSDKKVINHGMDLYKMTQKSQPRRTPKQKKKTYTENDVLNDLLNETAGSMDGNEMYESGPQVQYEEFPTMNSHDTGDIPNFSDMMSSKSTIKMNAAPREDMDGNPVNTATLPEDLSNAFTRNYSDLIKAMDKKKDKK